MRDLRYYDFIHQEVEMTLRSEKGKKGLFAVIMGLAWPTMLEQLMQTAVQYVDTAMVGVLGTAATAAVGSTGTVNWLIGSTTAALGVGFLAYISKALGAGDEESARRASAQSVSVAIGVGAILTAITLVLAPFVPVWMKVDPSIRDMAAEYFFILYMPMIPRTASTIFGTVLRAAGDTKTPMRIGLGVNLLNVVLNFMLIYPTRELRILSHDVTVYGAGLGVSGAAIASSVAFTVGGVLITVALFGHKRVSPRGSLLPDGEILRPCFKVALPNMLQRFFTSFGYIAFASMINSVGDVATAAHTIANTVESAFYIPGYGMNTAAATLVGNAYGARDVKRMRRITRAFIPIEIVLMTISGGLLFIFAPSLVGLFSSSEEVVRLGTIVLRMVALSEPFYGFPIIAEGFLLGVGNTRTPFIFNTIGMWGVRIVGTFILINVLGHGLVAAWGAMIMHNILLFALYLVCYLRKRWNPLERESDVNAARDLRS